MIKFMLLAAPRSGTTWAANWLTTDTTCCLHDPLFHHHYRDLDSIESKAVLGVSCTGLLNFPEYVNSHPARKIILHRPQAEIEDSLKLLGLPFEDYSKKLQALEGLHMDWQALFESPLEIYEYLLQKPFNSQRHTELVKMNIEPKFAALTPNPAVMQELLIELRGR